MEPFQVTAAVSQQLIELVTQAAGKSEEMGGIILVADGGWGMGSKFVELENRAPWRERTVSYAPDPTSEASVHDECGDMGCEPVLFHSHPQDQASELSEDDVRQFNQRGDKAAVVHGRDGFVAYRRSSDEGFVQVPFLVEGA